MCAALAEGAPAAPPPGVVGAEARAPAADGAPNGDDGEGGYAAGAGANELADR